MENFKHHIDARVRWYETDLQGVSHHSNYLRYFEIGRVDYMRQLNLIEGNDFVGPATVAIVESKCVHKTPLRFDDPIRIFTRIAKLTGATMTFEYKILNRNSDEISAEGHTILATVDRKTFKPVRMTEIFRKKISEFEGFK